MVVGGVALVAAAAACASLSGLSGGSPVEDGGTDAPSEGAPTDAATVDPCRHAVIPAAPAIDDDPSTSVPPLVLAIRTVSITGGLDGGATPGFDLDGVCTCFPDETTAHKAKPSCLAPSGSSPACDGDGGADRQLGNIIGGYPELLGQRLPETGGPTLLLEITKYNGRANDSDVFVGIFPSQGIYDGNAACMGGAGFDASAPPYTPTWTGCDRWALDSLYVLPGTAEPKTYLHAYVSDHVLVVPPSDRPVAFVAGNAALPVSSALLTARLVAVDPGLVPIVPAPTTGTLFRMEDGVVAGRVGTKDALRALATSEATTDGGPLCGFPSFFTSVKTSFVCPNADIMRSEMMDFNSVDCDAISLAAAFAAQPAQLGNVRAANKRSCADPNDPKFDALFDCTK
jgi:hypothetical protein